MVRRAAVLPPQEILMFGLVTNHRNDAPVEAISQPQRRNRLPTFSRRETHVNETSASSGSCLWHAPRSNQNGAGGFRTAETARVPASLDSDLATPANAGPSFTDL